MHPCPKTPVYGKVLVSRCRQLTYREGHRALLVPEYALDHATAMAAAPCRSRRSRSFYITDLYEKGKSYDDHGTSRA
jgi:hypothetical protein